MTTKIYIKISYKAPSNHAREIDVFTLKTHQMFSVHLRSKASGVCKFLRFEKRIQKALLL